jgi:hypothetical protein
MSRYYLLGGLSIIGGVVMVLFQAVASMMTAGDMVWKKLSLAGVVNAGYLGWVEGISPLEYIVAMPLYILLIAVGVILFIVGAIVQK